MAMSDQAVNRCEPPGQLRWVDGWHWLDGDQPIVAYWSAASDYHPEYWRIDSMQYSSQGAHKHGHRYLAPVATPAEVEALAATADRLRSIIQINGLAAGHTHAEIDEMMER
jgi:hypothetical protein